MSDGGVNAKAIVELFPFGTYHAIRCEESMSERTEDTIELLKTQLLVQPNNPSKRYMLGKAYAKIGDFPNAIDNLKRAVRFNDEYGNAYYRLGLAYVQTEAISDAATAFEGAVKHGAKEIIPAWYHLATTRRQLEQFEEARQAYEKLLELDPTHRDGLVEAADSNVALYRWADASALYARATQIDENDASLFYRLGTSLMRPKPFVRADASIPPSWIPI